MTFHFQLPKEAYFFIKDTTFNVYATRCGFVAALLKSHTTRNFQKIIISSADTLLALIQT